MDHLFVATKATQMGDDAPTEDTRTPSEWYQSAIAHALIALVERLDRMTAVSGDGTSAFLRVDA